MEMGMNGSGKGVFERRLTNYERVGPGNLNTRKELIR
jgi:hypothetical protein